MIRSVKKILDMWQKGQADKLKWDTMYQDVVKYGMPGRYTQTRDLEVRVDHKGETHRKELYTSVMEQSCDRFVQRIQSILTPVSVNWIDLEAGHFLKNKAGNGDEVNRELSKIAEILNVFKDTSNFDSVVSEAYYDLIVGTMCLLLLEGTPESPLRFVAIPFKDIVLEEGLFGEIGAVYRKLKIKRSLIPHQWTDAKKTTDKSDPQKDDEEIDLIESTYFDYDDGRWIYVVIDPDKKTKIVERTYQANPFIVLRWSKCAGEIYGRGLGLKALSDVKTLNKIMEFSLRILAHAVPVYMADVSEGYDPSTFVMYPGAVNPVPSTATNRPTLAPLPMNQAPDMSAYRTEQLEMNIKRCMLDNTIPNDPNRHLTATEISHRSEELQGSFSNSFGRIMTEFMYPLIRRMIEVLQNVGYLDKNLNIRDFNGFGYKIKINTILASQQRSQEVQNTLSAIQAFASLDPNMQLLPKTIKLIDLVPDLMRKMGIDDRFISTSAEIKQAEEQEALAAQVSLNADAERQMMIDTNKEVAKHDATA